MTCYVSTLFNDSGIIEAPDKRRAVELYLAKDYPNLEAFMVDHGMTEAEAIEEFGFMDQAEIAERFGATSPMAARFLAAFWSEYEATVGRLLK